MPPLHKKESSGRSITVEKAREILGDKGNAYSDEEIQLILEALYGFAESAYYDYISTRKDSSET